MAKRNKKLMKNNKKVVRSLHLLPLRPTPSGITAVFLWGVSHRFNHNVFILVRKYEGVLRGRGG